MSETSKTVMEWTPTPVIRRDPWNMLLQLWVRVRLVEHTPKNDLDYIKQEEVTDAQWRKV